MTVEKKANEFDSDWKAAKWLKATDFSAALAVLHGKPYPQTRDDLAAWLKTNEGRDAYKAQQAFEKLELVRPLNPPELTLRMALEIIKKGAGNLKNIPIHGHINVIKSWAKACTAYVRYSRALQASLRYRIELTYSEKVGAIEAFLAPLRQTMYVVDTKANGTYDTLVGMLVEASFANWLESNGKDRARAHILLETDPMDAYWISMKDAESLIGSARVPELTALVDGLKDSMWKSLEKTKTSYFSTKFYQVKKEDLDIIDTDLKNATLSQLTIEFNRAKQAMSQGRIPAMIVFALIKNGIK